MAGPIDHEGDLLGIGDPIGARGKTVESRAQSTNDLDVLFFVMAADIVAASGFAAFKHRLQCANVVVDIKPVAHLIAFAVHR